MLALCLKQRAITCSPGYLKPCSFVIGLWQLPSTLDGCQCNQSPQPPDQYHWLADTNLQQHCSSFTKGPVLHKEWLVRSPFSDLQAFSRVTKCHCASATMAAILNCSWHEGQLQMMNLPASILPPFIFNPAVISTASLSPPMYSTAYEPNADL